MSVAPNQGTGRRKRAAGVDDVEDGGATLRRLVEVADGGDTNGPILSVLESTRRMPTNNTSNVDASNTQPVNGLDLKN